jgi:hypothetical protein
MIYARSLMQAAAAAAAAARSSWKQDVIHLRVHATNRLKTGIIRVLTRQVS